METQHWQTQPILARDDGSYVITVNDYPYHVPDEGDYADLYAEVRAFAAAHPEALQAEPEPEPEKAPLPGEALQAAHAAIRNARRAAEYGGVMVHGLLFPTDQKSELRLSGLERKFAANPAHVEPWLVGETWVYMHAALFAEYAEAFAAHVASCFAVEKGRHEALNAAGCETAGEVEEWLAANLRSGWPGDGE